MSSSILFSLLVPSYNRPELIRETVNSLLADDSRDLEIIVSDDASPRRTEIKTAVSGLIQSGRIKYIQQEKNLGWSNNRNALVAAAQGEYVILLGDDDRLKAGAIHCLREWTIKYPEVSIFGFGYDIIDERGNRVFTLCTPKSILYEIRSNDHWKEILAYDAVPMWSHHPFTLCSKREVALAIRYNPTVDIADDVVFIFDALEQGHKFMTIPEILFQWRVAIEAGGSYSTLSGSMERCYRTRGLILAEWLNRPALRQEVASLLRDPRFLARFCMFKSSDAIELLRLLDAEPADGKALGDFICDRAMVARLSFLELLERQARAVKVMGFMHVLNYLRYKWDQNRLAGSLRKKATRSP